MKTFIIGLIGLVVGCSSYNPSGCPGNEVDCYGKCYDPTHYSCSGGNVVLTSCDNGYQICKNIANQNVCVPFPSDCCPQGGYCYASICGSQNKCNSYGSNDCNNGKYCPFGHVCTNNGNNCSP